MAEKELVEYIKKHLNLGYKREHLEEHLKKQGYREEYIKEAFEEAKGKIVKGEHVLLSEVLGTHQSQKRFLLEIALVLLIGMTSVFVYQYWLKPQLDAEARAIRYNLLGVEEGTTVECGTNAQCFIDAAELCIAAKATLRTEDLPQNGAVLGREPLDPSKKFSYEILTTTQNEIVSGSPKNCTLYTQFLEVRGAKYYSYGKEVTNISAIDKEDFAKAQNAALSWRDPSYRSMASTCNLPTKYLAGTNLRGFKRSDLQKYCTGKNALALG